jgi:uncharacterized membrane protein
MLVQGFTVVLVSFLRPAAEIGWTMIAITVLGMSAAAGSVAVGLVLAFRRYERARATNIAMMTLTADERQVFEAIVRASGDAYQDKLRRELDMSKAKLSALVNNLERKHVITKERFHKTNILRVSKEFAGR